MRKITMVMMIGFLFVGQALAATSFQTGILGAVDVKNRTVSIDGKRYLLAEEDLSISFPANPGKKRIQDLRKGQRVRYAVKPFLDGGYLIYSLEIQP